VGEQSNLDIRRPGVALVNPKICDRFRFFFHTSVTDPFPFLLLWSGESMFGSVGCKALFQ
jgi:hypothetical protein